MIRDERHDEHACTKILHVDVDSFFASVEQVMDPSLAGRPVIVGGLATDSSVVASASREAKARGVKTAMSIREARRICPDAVFLRGEYANYRAFSERLLALLEGFSPTVEIAALDDFYLDLRGTERLFGPAFEVAARIRERVKADTKLSVSVGIGANRLIAKMASDFAKPGGICEVWTGYEREFLAPLSVEELTGVGHRTTELLNRLNIYTVGELAQLDPTLLERVFGVNGRIIHQRSLGIDEAPIIAHAPKSISRETTFETDVSDRSVVEAMLHYLIERAANKLRQLGLTARCVHVKVRYADFESAAKSQTLAAPADRDDELFAAAMDVLKKILTRRVRVRHVGVRLSEFRPGATIQLDLFAGQRARRAEGLYRALDRIRERFGFSAVTVGKSLELLNRLPRDKQGFKLRTACLNQ
jgi:DNA polymerase-4